MVVRQEDLNDHDAAIIHLTDHRTQKKYKKLPAICDVFASQHIPHIWNANPFQVYTEAVSNAASGATRWMEDQVSEHQFSLSYTSKKPQGTTTLSLYSSQEERDTEQAQATLWKQVRSMSDLDSDVYLTILAQMLNGGRDKDGWCWITADKILDYRGIVPKKDHQGVKEYKAGHRQEDIRKIAECMDRLRRVRISVDLAIFDDPTPADQARAKTAARKRATGKDVEPKKVRAKLKERRYTYESTLILMGGSIRRNELWQGETGTIRSSEEVAWQVREAPWMTPFIEHGPNGPTVPLLQSILHYDPYREIWEKRLGKYLMAHFRINKSSSIQRGVGKLLEELSFPIDTTNPVRTRDRFEKALARLQHDGHLSCWRYKDEVQLPARNWVATWLEQDVILSTPTGFHIVDAGA